MKTKESPQDIYLEMKRRQQEKEETENSSRSGDEQKRTLKTRVNELIEWYGISLNGMR